MPEWLYLYHRLPYPLRMLAATTRGWYLRQWRYSQDTERLAQEALEREAWSPDRWQVWQEERLAYVLHRAATRVPYYRAHWQHRRAGGDRSSWEVLENWPLLSKEELRTQPLAFVADDCDVRRMFPEHTSGTTGKPLRLWWSRATVRQWYALYEARVRLWNGISRKDRWGILGGQLVAPVSQTEPPFWVWNSALRQLYLSSYHLSPGNVQAYMTAMRRHGIAYLLGYPSAMATLAQVVLEQGLHAPKLRVALSNAEPLFPYQREAVTRAFGCPVRDTYGMAEIVSMATECSSGKLHLWPEVGVMDVWRDDFSERVRAGEEGALVCTGLLNADMPLIRYQVGDRGRLAPDITRCSCGRCMPVLQSVEGRMDDVLVTRDGRRVGRLDPIFKEQIPIREAQIVQEDYDRVRVRYVPGEGFKTAHADTIRKRLQDRMGNVEVVFEPVQALPRTANGKVRSVISNVGQKHVTRQEDVLSM